MAGDKYDTCAVVISGVSPLECDDFGRGFGGAQPSSLGDPENRKDAAALGLARSDSLFLNKSSLSGPSSF